MTITAAGPTVLVVDDEPDMRELARAFLELDGFNVIGEATDGGEAVQRYVDLDPPPLPAAVILDNRMPVLTGLEAAERMLERHPEQVIVLFSAHLDETVEQEARELGVAACVSKMHTAELPAILRGILDPDRVDGVGGAGRG